MTANKSAEAPLSTSLAGTGSAELSTYIDADELISHWMEQWLGWLDPALREGFDPNA